MAKVDFYLLSASGEHARQLFACRLAEKAYKLKNRVNICVPSQDAARVMDDLLWTFRDISFVPHEIVTPADGQPDAPVTIACGGLPGNEYELLINLCDASPENFGSFPRVAEIVSSDEESKSRGRQRFVDYRSQGHTLDTHNL